MIGLLALNVSACGEFADGLRAGSLTYTSACGTTLPPGLAAIVSPAWCDLSLSGDGVVVGVVDAGFDGLRDDPFTRSLRVVATTDLVDGDASDFFSSHSGHGTEIVASLGGRSEAAAHGLAWGASYVLARTEDVGTETPDEEERLAEGVAWAISQGARVVNVSLGYNAFDDPADDYAPTDLDGRTPRVTRALDALAAANPDVLIVVSAGNEGDGAWRYVLPPGDARNVLTVGAVGAEGRRASYSGMGSEALPYTKPDLTARPIGRGASLAAPMIAGLAAQLFEHDPSLTAAEVADLLRRSGTNAASPNREVGYGTPQADVLLSMLREDAEG